MASSLFKLLPPPATETRFELFFVIIINFIDNNIQYIFVFYNLFELTQNILNEVKHRKIELEQFLKEKVALEEKIGEEDVIEEDNQRLLECIGMISRHKREIKI